MSDDSVEQIEIPSEVGQIVEEAIDKIYNILLPNDPDARQREFWKRSATREVARKIRQRDNTSNWPRDVKSYRYRRLRDGKVGRWGEVARDGRKDDT